MKAHLLRMTLLGVGAMNSPRYAPAGLLIEYRRLRVMFDGGPGAAPAARLDAWLLTDARCELIQKIRTIARHWKLEAQVGSFVRGDLAVSPRAVVHTSHATYGYLLTAGGKRVVWAPEFFTFPHWARGADLMFAEAAGWDRPIRFAKAVGGHCPVLEVAEQAQRKGVKKLVFAHIGRPTIRAIDAGKQPPFGEFGSDRKRYVLRVRGN